VAPRSLGELEALVRTPRAERAESVATEAWSEGMRYLRLSREALADGESERADRFAELGLVHTKIAIATAREVLAGERLETARRERHDIELELERVRSDLSGLEQQIERERMRAHLGQVVDETRLRAAADEELREQSLGEREREELRGARLKVARELVGRAALGLETLRALAAADALLEERVLPTRGSIEEAFERLRRGDLAGVQQHCEVAGVETRRVWQDLWSQQDEGADERALEALEKALTDAGLASCREELGVGVSLGGIAKGKLDKRAREAVAALQEAVGERVRTGGVQVLVVAVDRAGAVPREAVSKSSEARSEATAGVLVEAGFPEARVFHRGYGAATPLEVLLDGRGDRVAVLLVPIPGAK
jgi:hypothetical protein